MRIGAGKAAYEWIDNWARVPDTEAARTAWAHPGIVVSESGDVITCHQGGSTILVFDRDGNLKASWESGVTDGHGMTLVREGGEEYLWIADNGSKRQPRFGYEYPPGSNARSGQVVKTRLDGRAVANLEKPPVAVYESTRFSPTSVAVNEERFGGNGDVWVADGYGASYVHRFDRHGGYVSSINGEEGAGRFNCPHGIFIDRRKPEPELYVADRANARIQVYDLEGKFKGAFGKDFLTTPSAFVTHGELMVVAELRGRLTVLDINDKLVCYLGENEAVCSAPGWPNNKDESGNIIPSRLLEAGKFNSPHGLAVDADGNLYVAEWLIGGRFTKLKRLPV